MRDQDRLMIAMLRRHLIGPADDIAARPKLQRDDQELASLRGKTVVTVLDPVGLLVVSSTKARSLTETGDGKIVVHPRGAIGAAAPFAVIVIARRHEVGNMAVEGTHRGR